LHGDRLSVAVGYRSMSRLPNRIRLIASIAVAIVAARVTTDARSSRVPVGATTTTVGVSLKISSEIAPPGGLAQMKVFVTEPKPISTAFADVGVGGFFDVAGIALGTRDALGVALVNGSRVRISVLSPSTSFGMTPDYPVLTIAGHVSPSAVLGAVFPVDMDPAAVQFTDATGAVYPTAVNPGSLTVMPNVGIEDVTPGSGTALPGEVVMLTGRSFSPATQVNVKEAVLSSLTAVDATHLAVTFAAPTELQGAGLEVVNPDGTKSKYFSYQRTARQTASLNPTLQASVPVFADVNLTNAIVPIRGHVTGVALQNRRSTRTFAVCVLVDASGAAIAARAVTIDPRRFQLLEVSELFGVAYSTSQTVHVFSNAPIQAMGVAVDAAGSVSPIPSR